MTPSSSNPADTSQHGPEPTHAQSTSIHDRVVEIANRSPDRSEFLSCLAADLQRTFGSAIVAIESSHWSNPMMLVVNELLSTQLRRDAIRELLRTASSMPCSCEVPTNDASLPPARAMRVQLADQPDAASVLLISSPQGPPAATLKIAQLKQLSQYANAARIVASQVPVAEQPIETFKADPTLAPAEAPIGAEESLDIARGGLRLFHLNLDLEETADRIANESRRLLGCDRTTLLVPRGKRLRVQSVSGVAVVDRRSNSIRSAERLADVASVLGKPLWLPGADPLPPQLHDPLDQYLDATDVTSVMLLPLYRFPDRDQDSPASDCFNPFQSEGELLGVLLLEHFTGAVGGEVTTAIRTIATEATLALNNSLEHRQVFGLRFWKMLGRIRRSLRHPWTATATCVLVAALLCAVFIQIDHQVIATGSLQPRNQRDVFASVDGTIRTIHVQDGQIVHQGDPLLTLENAELDQRSEKLSGEILTAQQRLASMRAVRLGSQIDPTRSSQIAMEQRQLESELTNLNAQQEIVRKQQADLEILSPIHGTVIAWQINRRLADRPVSKGNLLISVADHEGPWLLDLNIPDRDGGDVLSAMQAGTDLAITFASATAPEETFNARLAEIGTASRLNEQGRHVIDAVAEVETNGGDAFRADDHRVGADVTAKITCGKRSILSSWFGDVSDFVHRNILFYF